MNKYISTNLTSRMKLYLAREQQLTLDRIENKAHPKIRFSNAVGVTDITPEGGNSNEVEMEVAKQLQEITNGKVMQSLVEIRNADDMTPGPSRKRLRIYNLSLRIMLTARNRSDTNNMTFRVEGNILKTISNIFSSDVRVKLLIGDFLQNADSLWLSLTVANHIPLIAEGDDNEHEVEVYDWSERDSDDGDGPVRVQPRRYDVQTLSPLMSLSTKEMEIHQLPNSEDAYCEDNVFVPKPVWDLWVDNVTLVSGLFSVQLIFHKIPNFRCDVINSVNKRILDNGVATDLTIIAGNGAHVKCHKAFLLAHEIPAFAAMFGGEFEEGKTSTVKMDDMSEDGVKALLAFLYKFDIEAATQKCEIAFELLNAAVKYDISSLRSRVMNMMLKQDDAWGTVDVALQMFVLARGISDGEILQQEAINIIKRNSDNFKSSDLFRTLMTTNHAVMTEIVALICKQSELNC